MSNELRVSGGIQIPSEIFPIKRGFHQTIDAEDYYYVHGEVIVDTSWTTLDMGPDLANIYYALIAQNGLDIVAVRYNGANAVSLRISASSFGPFFTWLPLNGDVTQIELQLASGTQDVEYILIGT